MSGCLSLRQRNGIQVKGIKMTQSDNELTYFIRCNEFVKIGKSNAPEGRLYELQQYTPYKLKLLGTTNVPELELHKKFAYLRERGEWFHLTKEIRDYILKTIKSNGQYQTFKEREEKVKSIRILVRKLEKKNGFAGYGDFWNGVKELGYNDEEEIQEILEELTEDGSIS